MTTMRLIICNHSPQKIAPFDYDQFMKHNRMMIHKKLKLKFNEVSNNIHAICTYIAIFKSMLY